MKQLQVVYLVKHPLTGIVRYVGLTNNLPRRVCEHLNLKGHNLELHAFIANLALEGLVPTFETAFTTPDRQEAKHMETFYMLQYAANDLFNDNVSSLVSVDQVAR